MRYMARDRSPLLCCSLLWPGPPFRTQKPPPVSDTKIRTKHSKMLTCHLLLESLFSPVLRPCQLALCGPALRRPGHPLPRHREKVLLCLPAAPTSGSQTSRSSPSEGSGRVDGAPACRVHLHTAPQVLRVAVW